uniref:Uncharacterized protein n=1 Tax=Hemiselmis andersenii TaxID=464988 RepID=A0A6U4LLP0_HEMAN|mmetsp:Transcript_22759/g.52870  ORF Transcript_22759/g.52870 Transcript_22759/m.52870 type:complete len:361 (+) Transcript_22759:45-1127(+)
MVCRVSLVLAVSLSCIVAGATAFSSPLSSLLSLRNAKGGDCLATHARCRVQSGGGSTELHMNGDAERRTFLGVLAGGAVFGATGARAEMAPMGADVLDRPEFRDRQDLTLETELYEPEEGPTSLDIPYNGRRKPLRKMLGETATIVMNIKLDDPETNRQIPALTTLVEKYSQQGLNAICVPTDQGDYEPDDSTTVRIKVKQQFGMSSALKGPIVVTDKADIVGKFAHPLYKYMTTHAPNPNNVTRITLNYEKFLLDGEGNVLRRYPRQWGSDLIEKDVKAVISGDPLEPVSKKWQLAWSEADKEATRSMYSFRKHYNYYDQKYAGKDWAGTKAELFTPGSVEARFKGASKGKPLNVEAPE